ncbi:synaptotagmin-C-like [Diorhabda sublineata]|uniref:synaptotagmin-C-like n=1 Tax=Diorhabda sublineata TaxID=1163346 RepID=UPI0024E0B392|nr:synaptotagmin-C-like [Diorhabda sublineata]
MLRAPQQESYFTKMKRMVIDFILLLFCRSQSTSSHGRLKYLYQDIKFVPINLNKYPINYLGKIQPELYRAGIIKHTNDDGEEKTCGKVHFSLNYEDELENLVIKLFRVNDLPARDIYGFCDPYVKIFLPPNKKKKLHSKVKSKTRNPVFNETFTFNVKRDEIRSKSVEFLFYDYYYFSKNRLIGYATFNRIYEVVDLKHEIGYTLDIISIKKDKAEDNGRINICLCYLPIADRLIMTIFRCHKLKASALTGKSDPYVKIYMFLQDKMVKRKKTKIKKDTLNPVFNQAFVFEISKQQINDVTFVLRILDHDRVSKHDVMGYVVTGPKYIISKNHWMEILNKPRQNISQWYRLTEFLPISIPTPKDKTSKRPKWLKKLF